MNEKRKYFIEYCKGLAVYDCNALARRVLRKDILHTKYEKNVYTIMKCLGKSGAPTDGEVEYVNRWIKEYGFSLDIIKEACQRTVMATDHHRFEYAERILKSWYQSSVHSLKDIASADEAFQRKKNSMTASAKTTVNAFNQFKQNQYDYDDLLEKMKVN